MVRFFITGLPRSRTSWLANFFTYKDSFCFHELCQYGRDFMQLHQKMCTRVESYVGTSDCAVPYYFDDIIQVGDTWSLAIVERDFDDIEESLVNFHGKLTGEEYKALETSKQKIDIFKNKYNPYIIKFEDLNNINKVEELWYHCIPGLEFDADRFELLNTMNIQPEKKQYMDHLNIENVRSIMGV